MPNNPSTIAKSIFIAIGICITLPTSSIARGSHTVHSYNKKDGTHVESHRATNRDNTKHNNYSSKGNTNPNTGKEGTKDPDKK